MKIVSFLPFCATFALIACGSGGGSKAIYHPDVGPFDENGDYVVALADAPVKKNIFSRSKKPKAAPKPRKVEAPKPAPVQRMAQVAPPALAPVYVQAPAPVLVPAPAPVLVQAPAPVQVPVQVPVAVASPPQTVLIAQSPRPQAVAPVPAQPRPSVTPAPAPAPKPQAAAVKPKQKVPVRHVVRKSDTLFGLSRKYGVSVGAIQRANRIKGTTIITGKSLVIPR